MQNQYPDVGTRERLAGRIRLREERVEVGPRPLGGRSVREVRAGGGRGQARTGECLWNWRGAKAEFSFVSNVYFSWWSMRSAFRFRNLERSQGHRAAERAPWAPPGAGGRCEGLVSPCGNGLPSHRPAVAEKSSLYPCRLGSTQTPGPRGTPTSRSTDGGPAVLGPDRAVPPSPQVWFKNRRAKWRHQKRASASARLLPGAKKPRKESC